jgi:hypothetical protein
LAIALATVFASACASKNTFNAGQKLSGRYNTVVMGSNESYLFKEDGTFEHTGYGKDGSGSESGTYSIDGQNVTFKAGGKSVTTNISASKGDASKPSPEGLYIDVESYELSHSNLTKATPTPASKDNSVPAEDVRFAPAKVGAFDRERVAPYHADSKDAYKEAIRFIYDSNNYVDIKKYGSEAGAQADFKKRVSAAVPSAEYDKRARLGKCDPNKEGSDNKLEELIKSIPLKTGGEAVVLHPPKFWDGDCSRIISNGEENVVWANGVYVFEVFSTVQGNYTDAFGKAEAFFNDYQKATGQ